jgi:hypothetical protein
MNRAGTWLIRGLLAVAAVVWLATVTWMGWPKQPAPAWRADAAPTADRILVSAPRLARLPRPAPELAGDGVPIMPARASARRPEGSLHPHPITARHERIFEENRLIGALNGAVDVRDAAGLRKLLDRYRAAYPEDGQDVQAGYAAIADCLERPGEETRTAAQRWSDEHHGSTVRRFVRRICQLDGEGGS